MGVSAKQIVKTGKRHEIVMTVSSETDVRRQRDQFPGYVMSRTNLGPNSIRLTFRRA